MSAAADEKRGGRSLKPPRHSHVALTEPCSLRRKLMWMHADQLQLCANLKIKPSTEGATQSSAASPISLAASTACDLAPLALSRCLHGAGEHKDMPAQTTDAIIRFAHRQSLSLLPQSCTQPHDPHLVSIITGHRGRCSTCPATTLPRTIQYPAMTL